MNTIIIILLMCSSVTLQGLEENSTQPSFFYKDSNLKIMVNPIDNSVGPTKVPSVKPTSAQVAFEPGVPPGWNKPTTRLTTKRPSRSTTRKPYADSKNMTNEIEVIEIIETDPVFLEGEYENITETSNTTAYPPGVFPPQPVFVGDPERANPLDWLLGLFGVKPNQPNAPNQQHSTLTPAKSCNRCACGITFKHNRIVGGVETQVNEYPWMTALIYNNRFYCGGSLISSKHVLTAGHCVNGLAKDRLQVTFLDHDRSTTYETTTITRKIQNIIQHRLYGSGGSYNNDIALLQLEGEIAFSDKIRPVCLPALGKSFSGHRGVVIGWGATRPQGQVSNKLLEVQVPIMSNVACRNTGYGSRITDNMLCAGYDYGSKDSCQGDSGGPLHIINGSYHCLVGIVSWGEGCAVPNYPGVYTRVNRYLSWIYSNTRDGCYCNS